MRFETLLHLYLDHFEQLKNCKLNTKLQTQKDELSLFLILFSACP